MKLKELKELKTDKLKKTLVDFKREQFNLRFQQANNTLSNTARMRLVKKTIARIKTLMSEQAKQQ